ncbi:hypothetical protein Taro_010211 [Colocasia esculenta]|uniref:Uncharacterized protein n=1 Tax=Colocasia esculenta TaxID=4460 RepID=A0A843U8W2_COLES|nr:hypothetical protein [Colocasia esculenta]
MLPLIDFPLASRLQNRRLRLPDLSSYHLCGLLTRARRSSCDWSVCAWEVVQVNRSLQFDDKPTRRQADVLTEQKKDIGEGRERPTPGSIPGWRWVYPVADARHWATVADTSEQRLVGGTKLQFLHLQVVE